MDNKAIEEAARVLREALENKTPVEPVRNILPDATIEDAYAVQKVNVRLAEKAGRRLIGWKVGLTAKAVQRQFGVYQPDFGALFADFSVGDEEEVPIANLIQPRVEAEVAFVLGEDLPDSPITPIDILHATEFVLPAIEIVDSRVANWDISIIDTVADNASSAMFVVGPKPTHLTDHQVDLRRIRMEMTGNGEKVSEGTGAACLGHPVNAVVWLANTLSAVGQPLQAGDFIMSGALGPMVSVKPGTTYEATIELLGTVRAAFSE
jgi:2-keto-4-pentenoate hydratase